MLHEYFYKTDKRIDDEQIYNVKGKNFCRIYQNLENKLLMTMYDYFTFRNIKIQSIIFDRILLAPNQPIMINDFQNYLFKKTGINMKISIKPFKDYYPKFGIANVNMNEFKKEYKITTYVNKKVIHHNHMFEKNNIIDYICQNCNLKIKNTKELIVLFHNSKGYDNSYMIDIFSKIPDIQITCLAENNQKFKMLKFKLPNKKYSIKIIDSLSFLQGNLDSLSKDLDDDLKIVTKNEFQNNFKYVNKKLENFPYTYLNPENLNEKELPEMKEFDNILTMKKITKDEYKEVQNFTKK